MELSKVFHGILESISEWKGWMIWAYLIEGEVDFVIEI